ncbi:MAG: glycosyltransferase [Candidatus Bathyarchaeia archaeon]
MNIQKGEGIKVSVIIPTYHEGRYIETTLSNLARINHPLEIIVVDGGSRDGTVEIARRFTDKVYQIDERGISRAKNYGAKKANGDILVFLDANVIPPRNFMEKIHDVLSDSRVVGAACNFMPLHPRSSELIFFIFYNWLLRLCSKFKPHASGQFIAIRRKAFMAINGFKEDLPCVEDHDLAFRASKLGRFVFIQDLTVYESPRRIRKVGLLKVVSTWFIDYIFLILRGKPLSRVWPAVR